MNLRLRHLVLLSFSVCLAALMPLSARADDGSSTLCPHYSGTMSSEYKIGSERNIGEVAALIPIVCANDDLVYTDIRLKGDSEDGREMNIALGIRSLEHSGIAGGYVYLDRKKSGVTDKYFTQSTIGAEWLADSWDLRANAYLPLSDEKFADSGNPGVVVGNPFLNGSGLFVNVTGLSVLREVPMGGGDIEVGYKIPNSKLWLHGAGFAFDGDGAEALYGGRARARYDITDMLAVTAEGQHDNVRDNQGWLGLRVTVPFGTQNAAYKSTLRARMTDSPVRDVDIVTSAVEQDIPGVQQKAVLNTDTNQAQRVFHVDNSLGAAGDGTLATPFNTLAAASTAANRAGDIIYVHSGDGTSTNMDSGITLTQDSQSLIGEGVAFVYDGTRFRTTTGEDFTGTVLRAAGAAPVLSNSLGTAAVDVTAADDILLTGFNVDASTGTGIRLTNANNATIDTVTITNGVGQGIQTVYDDGRTYDSFTARNITSTNNANTGLRADVIAGRLEEFVVENSTFTGNTTSGIAVFASGGARFGDMRFTDITADLNERGISFFVTDADSGVDTLVFDSITANNNTSSTGINIIAQSGSTYGDIQLTDVTTNLNSSSGVNIAATQSTIDSISALRLTADGNNGRGLIIAGDSNSTINTVTLDDLHTHGNTGNGTALNMNTGSVTHAATLTNIDSQSNTNRGIYINANNSGTFTTVMLDQITASNNLGATGLGLDVLSSGDGSNIGDITLTNITSAGNAQQGTRVSSSTLGEIGTVTATNVTSNTNNGAGFTVSAGAGGLIGTATLDTITANGNIGAASTGIALGANNVSGAQAANIGTITATNLTANNNGLYGISVTASNTASVSNMNIDGATVDGNNGGVYLTSQTGGTLGNMTIKNATISNNAGRGIYALANNSAITNLTLDTLTISGQTTGSGYGIQLSSTSGASGTINATLTNVTTDNNANHGMYLQASATANLSVSVTDSTSTDNATNGIFVDDDTTGTYVADLGGGALGSLGNNRFFDNTGTEIRVDLDGGELKAENNWWGNVLGLQPGETTLDVGSTIDADPFLAADPGP